MSVRAQSLPTLQRAPARYRPATHLFRRYMSYGDATEFVPTYRLYLAGCNFRCAFCNVAPECFDRTSGQPLEPARTARLCVEALAGGAKTITILGGEPTLHVDTLLRIAKAAGRPLPIVLNTNGCFPESTVERLAGTVHTWVVDYKFGNDACAQRLAHVRRYLARLRPNLRHLAKRARLHVRHLLLPGHLDCCFEPVVRWLDEHLPGARFELTTGYVPAWQTVDDRELGGLVSATEIAQAEDLLATTTLQR